MNRYSFVKILTSIFILLIISFYLIHFNIGKIFSLNFFLDIVNIIIILILIILLFTLRFNSFAAKINYISSLYSMTIIIYSIGVILVSGFIIATSLMNIFNHNYFPESFTLPLLGALGIILIIISFFIQLICHNKAKSYAQKNISHF